MKRMRDESGQAAIIAVLSLTCILGFVGLATDVGVLLHAKRNLQIAADAAALAGANEIRVTGAGVADIQAAGKAASAQNGFTDGVNGTTVNIYPPPIDGPNLGKAGYVEAVVRRPQPTFFIQLVSSFASMPVSARAVAFDGSTTNTDCFNVTNGSLPDAMKLDGNFTLDAPGCQVIVNSNSLQALDFTGAAGTLTAGSVGVVGGVTGHAGDSSPAPVPVPQSSDPLASQVAPLTAAQRAAVPCTAAPSGNNWAPATAGGIVCYSSGTGSINSAVNLAAGTYIFTGSLGLQGHGSLTGPTVAQPDSSGGTAGVTIYLAAPGGNMDMSGAGNSSISLAGGSAAYPNIVIYEEPLDTNKVNMEGTPITTLAGIIYLPSALLELGGNGNFSQAIQADIIVNTFYEFGNATVTLTKFPSTGPGFQLDTVALVE